MYRYYRWTSLLPPDSFIDREFVFPPPNWQYYVMGGGEISHEFGGYLKFDFVPGRDSIAFTYIFAAEEWWHCACHEKTRVHFTALLSGPGIDGKGNIAKIPGTTLPICEKTINNAPLGCLDMTAIDGWPNCESLGYDAPYSEYYVANWEDTTNEFVYDGYTTPLVAKAAVNPCDTYTIEMRVQGSSDQWGLNIGEACVFFVEANSFNSYGAACPTDTATGITTAPQQGSISLYPNPFTSGLTLKLQHDVPVSKYYQLYIYDLKGTPTVHLEGSYYSINNRLASIGDELPSGLYLVRLVDAEGRSYKQQVVRR